MPEGIHGLLAEFGDAEALLEAARRAKRAGYMAVDAFAPYPIEGLGEMLEADDGGVAAAALAGGVAGGTGGWLMQWFAMARHYPMNVGGRPPFSWPAMLPVTFELTVLGAALAGLAAMLILNGLPMPHHPLFAAARFSGASDDRFFLCIEARDPHFSPEGTRLFLEHLGPLEVTEIAE
jgi:hypothetical protein